MQREKVTVEVLRPFWLSGRVCLPVQDELKDEKGQVVRKAHAKADQVEVDVETFNELRNSRRARRVS